MSEWSESEVQKVVPGVDDNRLVQFSSVVDETRYCIPRWLTLKDDKTVEMELYSRDGALLVLRPPRGHWLDF